MRFLRSMPAWLALVCIFTATAVPTIARAADSPPKKSARSLKHSTSETPFLKSEFIFPPESWHNHGSCVVEAPNGDLFACWFHGSGERKADDVRIEGSRLRRGRQTWEQRFTLADTPGYPDTNPCLFVDAQEQLWLFYPTILANLWESALMKFHVSRDWNRSGPPKWFRSEVLHVTPGNEFDEEVARRLPGLESYAQSSSLTDKARAEVMEYLTAMRDHTTNRLYRRLGWMTRAHPFQADHGRLIVPLYHDGFSFSLMAITDDHGKTWRTSAPLIGGGNIQPSIARRNDGTLVTLMRDNGPPPKRLHQAESHDQGLTWTPVVDSTLENPGSGADLIRLQNGHWLAIGNDSEQGRHSLAVWHSRDEGRTWPHKRHLENVPSGKGSFHYPSLLQSRDGSIHATYSHFVNEQKTIKHAHFNEAWLMVGAGQ